MEASQANYRLRRLYALIPVYWVSFSNSFRPLVIFDFSFYIWKPIAAVKGCKCQNQAISVTESILFHYGQSQRVRRPTSPAEEEL